MILSGPEIARVVKSTREARENGKEPVLPSICIEPYSDSLIGPNSYDVHLGDALRVYNITGSPYARLMDVTYGELSTRRPTPTTVLPIEADGFTLLPGVMYLGTVRERIEVHGFVPWIDGRSSCGRLSISVHQTAGRGDDGYCGNLTLEITTIHPVVVYPGDRIAQLTFFTLQGERKPYCGRYQGDAEPVASRIHLTEPPRE